jgi:hypothetical protein
MWKYEKNPWRWAIYSGAVSLGSWLDRIYGSLNQVSIAITGQEKNL